MDFSFFFQLQASTIDGRRKGACLFCQEYFMDLYLLAELKTISLKVINTQHSDLYVCCCHFLFRNCELSATVTVTQNVSCAINHIQFDLC